MENKNQINIEKFVYVLRRRLVLLIFAALFFGFAAGFATKMLVKPDYTAHTKFYVNASNNQNMTQSDLNVAKSLVDTYIEIIKSDTYLEEIAAAAGVDYSPSDIRERMSASSVGGTEIFKVSISDTDPKVAYQISSAMAEKGPTEIERVVVGGKVSVVDKPKMPTEPNSIGAKRNAVLGAAAGAIAVFAVFFIREVLDVTIYAEEDLTDNFEYPILGTIPTISAGNEKPKKLPKMGKYAGYAYRYGYKYGYGYGYSYGENGKDNTKKVGGIKKAKRTAEKEVPAAKQTAKPQTNAPAPASKTAQPEIKNEGGNK